MPFLYDVLASKFILPISFPIAFKLYDTHKLSQTMGFSYLAPVVFNGGHVAKSLLGI